MNYKLPNQSKLFKNQFRSFDDRGSILSIVDQQIQNEGLIPDAMIYMTDGYGDFPEECPVPTLWAVPESGLKSENFPFGEVLRIPEF